MRALKYSFVLLLMLVVAVSAYDFCEDGTVGEDKIRIVSVADMLNQNNEEWVWQTEDRVELEVRIQNRVSSSGNYIVEAVFLNDGKVVEVSRRSDDLKKEVRLSANERVTVPITFEVDSKAESGEYEIYFKLYKSDDEENECVEKKVESVEIIKFELCEKGTIESNELEIRAFTDHSEDKKSEWNWYPGREVIVSVDVRNRDFSERDFEVDLFFVDENLEIVDVVEKKRDLTRDTTLDKRDTADLVFRFKLKEDIVGKYDLYARFYDSSNEEVCVSNRARGKSGNIQVSIQRKDREIKLEEVSGPTKIVEGEKVSYSLKVSNIGSKDENKVNVIFYERNLGISEGYEIKDLKSGETGSASFSFSVPSGYNLTNADFLIYAEYDYDVRRDYYKSILTDEGVVKLKAEILAPAIVENLTIEENAEFVNGSEIEEVSNATTLITGQVVSNRSRVSGFFSVFLFIVLIGVASFFVSREVKKRKKIKDYVEPNYKVRKYTARLN